ncbi:hypothetical protein [Salmonella phage vB_SenS_SB10]|uniref:Uncharacterized protein n=1 Tax=Salmonella phage vB_SenS_SB10 TaxID=2591134 RepID=A0A5J6T997_9CAUD|nr:hypothetical protein [Salmonella phage vB_SenS_SB10]
MKSGYPSRANGTGYYAHRANSLSKLEEFGDIV